VKKNRVGSLFLVLLAVSSAVHAEPLDRLVEEVMREHHIPGAAVAIVQDGAVVRLAGYGSASLEHEVAVTPDTLFEIGSLTKGFTAVAVLLLAEEGKISLDHSICSHIDDLPEPWCEVEVGHLLTHTSGIRNKTDLTFDEFLRMSRQDFEPREVFALIGEELASVPGERMTYNNTGYYLLGMLVDSVSGKSYWEFVRERIFAPLGMADSRSTEPRAVVPRRASGYEWRDGRYERRDALSESFALSAGGLMSSVRDMARFEAAVQRGELLSKESWKLMFSAVRHADGTEAEMKWGEAWLPDGPYGMGWALLQWKDGHRYVEHGGETPGFCSGYVRAPEEGVAVILLTNRGMGGARHVYPLTHRILRSWIERGE
jgi:D-alanyl-D-alanine carboxypeptidase